MTQDLQEQLDSMLRENKQLYSVLDVNAIISSTLNLNKVLDTLMTKAREVMNAEASSMMLLEEEKDELYFHTILGESDEALRGIRLKLGEGIAGWVAQEGQPLLVEDCSKDPRFSRKGDKVSHFVTRSMMCVPLKARKRVLGTVQVLNKNDGTFFNNKDLKIFEVLATGAAIAIENARLHEMATVDAMTKLYRKAYFMARLQEEFRRARNKGKSVSLMMTDIDFFKKVNDNHGHQGGDAALIFVAQVVNNTVRELGGELLAGRYGGEEFCVLMPDTDPETGVIYGEKIRKNIEDTPVPIGDKEARITISIGISSYPLHTEFIKDEEDLVRLADEALYICKNNGRNCVKIYSEKEAETSGLEK